MCTYRKKEEDGNPGTWVLDSNMKVTSKSQKFAAPKIFFTCLREEDNDVFL